MTSLPRSAPETEGVSSAALDTLVTALESLDRVHSFMLLRHGRVVGEQWWAPAAPELPHQLWSITKSFTSTAVGLAVTDGVLTIDDRVIDLLPEDVPDRISEHLARLRVRHLLTMTTGHAAESLVGLDESGDDNWARFILATPIDFEPGTHFVYNSGGSYLLSAIVQRLTGESLLDYLTPRVLDPLGIVGASWEVCPRGINTGGWGLSARTEDLARFGQLYLQHGVWNGAQLVPAEWVAAATSWQVANGDPAAASDWSQGYGYQFWQCRHGAYRGDGKLGQFCIVMPEQDAVLAITADLIDMQEELDAVWEHLLPALLTL